MCGNGLIDPGESCDGANVGNKTCTDPLIGFDGGTLGCTSTCAFDTSGCDHRPVPHADAFTTPENVALNITPAQLLGNDTDSDGDPLQLAGFTNGTGGTFNAASFVFTPNTDFVGNATFTYTISDGVLTSSPGTVTINVTAVPRGVDDTFTTAQGAAPLHLGNAQLVGNDHDEAIDPLTVSQVSFATNGTASLSAGVVTFTPNAGFIGNAGFIYTAQDARLLQVTAHVTVTVTGAANCGDHVLSAGEFCFTSSGFLAPSSPSALVAFDIDNDGQLDLAFAVASPNAVQVGFNTGGGSFAISDNPMPGTVGGVGVGDVDEDPTLLPDVVATITTTDQISVLLHQGARGFQPRLDFATTHAPGPVAIGNVDGDFFKDVVVGGQNGFSVMLNDDTGRFPQHVDTPRNPVKAVLLADLDQDGFDDLVIATTTPSIGQVEIFRNRQSPAQPYPSSPDQVFSAEQFTDFVTGLAAGDLDGDGDLDLVASLDSGSDATSLMVLRNNGFITFTQSFMVLNVPLASVALGDVNEDNKLDAVGAIVGSSSIAAFPGDGTGLFNFPQTLTTDGGPSAVAVGDVSGDGLADICVAATSGNKIDMFSSNP